MPTEAAVVTAGRIGRALENKYGGEDKSKRMCVACKRGEKEVEGKAKVSGRYYKTTSHHEYCLWVILIDMCI